MAIAGVACFFVFVFFSISSKLFFFALLLCPYLFIVSICLVNINMFARFDEISSMPFADTKETKCHERTYGRQTNEHYVASPHLFTL